MFYKGHSLLKFYFSVLSLFDIRISMFFFIKEFNEHIEVKEI